MTPKRFRIFDIENQSCPAKFDTTEECYKFLKDKDRENFFVDCVIDDIEVDAERFCEAFDDGELPGDLQFF